MNTSSIVTAPSIEATTKLFNAYKSLEGNSSKTRNDFYQFLTTPGIEREVFLAQYTESEIDNIGDIIIQKLNSK